MKNPILPNVYPPFRTLAGMLPVLLLMLLLLPNSALAYQSFTVMLSAYQGLQLATGMTAFDPTVLTVIIGDAADIDRIAAPAIDPLFQFDSDVDLFFGFTADAAEPIAVTAVSVTGIAVIENTGFTDLTDDLLGSLDFTDRVVSVDSDDLVALLMADGTTLFLEQITTSPDATISFTYWTPDTVVVPESATLLLLGVGIVGLFGMRRRIHAHRSQKGEKRMKSWKILLSLLVGLLARGHDVSAVTLTIIRTGQGSGMVNGDDIYCGSFCEATYDEGTVIHFKAIPDEDSIFAGWLVNGQSSNGVVTLNEHSLVAARFDLKSPPPEDESTIYWYVGGGKDWATRVSDEIAVFPKPAGRVTTGTEDVAFMREVLPCFAGQRFYTSTGYKRGGDEVYFIGTEISFPPAQFSEILQCLTDCPSVHTASPVFYHGKQVNENRLVLTGKIIVKFPAYYTEDEILAIEHTYSLTRVETLLSFFLYNTGQAWGSLDVANRLYESGLVLEAYPNWWRELQNEGLPNDEYFSKQWGLLNTGQSGGTVGEDINIADTWNMKDKDGGEDIRGQGVVIAIHEFDGSDITHPDLVPNVVPDFCFDFVWGWNVPGYFPQADYPPSKKCTSGPAELIITEAVFHELSAILAIPPDILGELSQLQDTVITQDEFLNLLESLLGWESLKKYGFYLFNAFFYSCDVPSITDTAFEKLKLGGISPDLIHLLEVELKGKLLPVTFMNDLLQELIGNENFALHGEYLYTIFMEEGESINWHGTKVAGVAAAHGFSPDNEGISGTAPWATIAGYRTGQREENLAKAAIYNADLVDVVNMSWGYPGFVKAPLILEALKSGSTLGRGGKGLIYVASNGNGGFREPDSNADEIANSRYTIAVGASNHDGKHAIWSDLNSKGDKAWSSPGANVLVNAPGGGCYDDQTCSDKIYPGNIYTTGGGHSYEYVRGTSFAAPVVSGVVALMLQVNPELTWRDVQHILITTAKMNDPTHSSWDTSGIYPYSHYLGFGRVDAKAAVEAAQTWTTVSPEVVVQGQPQKNDLYTITISENILIEFVEVTSFTATEDNDPISLPEIILISPAGTRSILMGISAHTADFENWHFGSVRHFGEYSQGNWKISIQGSHLTSWALKIYGTELPPTWSLTTPTASACEVSTQVVACQFDEGRARVRLAVAEDACLLANAPDARDGTYSGGPVTLDINWTPLPAEFRDPSPTITERRCPGSFDYHPSYDDPPADTTLTASTEWALTAKAITKTESCRIQLTLGAEILTLDIQPASICDELPEDDGGALEATAVYPWEVVTVIPYIDYWKDEEFRSVKPEVYLGSAVIPQPSPAEPLTHPDQGWNSPDPQRCHKYRLVYENCYIAYPHIGPYYTCDIMTECVRWAWINNCQYQENTATVTEPGSLALTLTLTP